jgi:hypothetical protein
MKHEPGIVEFNCFVCKSKIAENPVHIGEGIFRHKRCAPGSKKWMESEVGTKSPYREFFKKKGEK